MMSAINPGLIRAVSPVAIFALLGVNAVIDKTWLSNFKFDLDDMAAVVVAALCIVFLHMMGSTGPGGGNGRGLCAYHGADRHSAATYGRCDKGLYPARAYSAVWVMFFNSATRRNAMTGIAAGLAIFLSPIPEICSSAAAGILAMVLAAALNWGTRAAVAKTI